MIEERTTTWPQTLRMLRRERVLTQSQAARRAGVAVTSWKTWEQGKHLPHEYSAGRIAKAFDVAPESLPRPAREN
jgi:transcriptional regulator with XRE-family HTH domain